MSRTKNTTQPWDKGNPKPAGRSRRLAPLAKAAAKRRAQAAGRPYPNLVDNMRAAAAGEKSAAKKTARAEKAGSGRSSAQTHSAGRGSVKKAKAPAASQRRTAAMKDPRGGLTAAGRAEFARKQGAHLQPGVTKPDSEMTPLEMRRKGSWATRFYGRATLPPLVKANGEPTRFALSAHAWGEKVPTTEAAARKIAEKGRRLLLRYHREKGGGP